MIRVRVERDSTHAAIVKALRKVGVKVADCSRLGNGFPDLVARVNINDHGYIRPRVILMEVKTARGKLTPEQEQFIADWPETVIVRSVDEALAAVGVR